MNNITLSGKVEQVTLTDGDMRLNVLSYGARTMAWRLGEVPLILGYRDPRQYLQDTFSMGAIVGPVANRIRGAAFDLGGVRYNLDPNAGAHTLHGGAAGLGHCAWTIAQETDRDAVLTYTSKPGEGGFPAEVAFEIRVSLRQRRLTYAISAVPDRPTPISLAQHNYYTLGQTSGIAETCLRLAAAEVLEADSEGIPTGRRLSAADEGLDFTRLRKISAARRALDDFFLFDPARDRNKPVAELLAPSGIAMSVRSDQPGTQVYTGAHLGAPFGAGAGLCIEPAGYTNAVNTPEFPSVIYTPDQPYKQMLTLEIAGVG